MTHYKLILTFLIGVALLSINNSCSNENEEELFGEVICEIDDVTFSGTIQPILSRNCALSGCHVPPNPANGYDYTTYEGVKFAVDVGRILGALRREEGFSPMPRGRAMLPSCEIEQITTWIEQGALNN